MKLDSRAALLVVALLAACGPAAAPTGTPAASTPAASATAAASPTATAAANIPAVVCVGESTTYLDWLNGDFLPDTVDPFHALSSDAVQE